MIEAYAPDQIRAAEERLGEELRSGELMRRAARGLAEVVMVRLEEREAGTVVGLVGPGNNGADTLHALAHLAHSGINAAAVTLGASSQLDTAAPLVAGAVEAATAAGVLLHPAGSEGATAALGEAEVVLDGIYGIGGRAGLPDDARDLVDAIDEDAFVIAVDVPSGQDPEGGSADPDAVWADESVTFATPKPVHLLPATEAATGRLTVVDIGLDLTGEAPVVRRLTRDDVAAHWPVPLASDDKYSRGVLGIVAGGEDYSGAAVLATTAAVSAGVGMVRYVGTPTPTALVRAAVPEAVHGDGRVQAWLIGPGLDVAATGEDAAAQLDIARAALASDLPTVVDAGGLDLVEGPRDAPTLLTPHAGECARLLGRLRADADEPSAEDVTAHEWDAAGELADLTGATVLLKGATTVVRMPGEVGGYSQAEAPAWLATAGAGDVLAGLLGALLAGGVDPSVAGALGALVHGVAAEDANPGGPVRALAVAHALPSTVAGLLRRGLTAP
ncbi:bifunctional ADP-dependent NAD(P)H-hydrate dehydratase/NAD(P)H-hydrate epimerase [Janibacter sp. G56]|uniref:bifunctional ADP-dependent NAD(P)H-hydrate dehydratase/NAD(P)H-hydrate epimerase n=1 Tax=Janibacter sp. G56 TaxID=3418717 RepID=UPI003D08CC03